MGKVAMPIRLKMAPPAWHVNDSIILCESTLPLTLDSQLKKGQASRSLSVLGRNMVHLALLQIELFPLLIECHAGLSSQLRMQKGSPREKADTGVEASGASFVLTLGQDGEPTK